MKIADHLRTIGFYRAEEAIGELCARAARMVKDAGNPEAAEKFDKLPSCLSPQEATSQHPLVLTIDVGGTSTKAGVRFISQNSAPSWVLFFEIPNTDLDDKKLGKSMHRFCSAIVENVVRALPAHSIGKDQISTCGVIWSNAVKNVVVPNAGVTGLVAQRAHYHKGEWYIADLKDGDDLGQIFVDAFAAHGIKISRYLLANDTPLTMKAGPGADAGMVLSTGLNGTIVDTVEGKLTICNAEMGGRMIIPEALRTEADFIGDDQPAELVEYLVSGKFLPRLFISYVNILAGRGVKEFQATNQFLQSLGTARWAYFTAEDISLLIKDQGLFITRRQGKGAFDAQALLALSELSREILTRAAKLAAVIAYATVSNQLALKNSFAIALDSSLCREIPPFRKTMNEQLKLIMPAGKEVQVLLLDRLMTKGGYISVPMQGTARALDSFR